MDIKVFKRRRRGVMQLMGEGIAIIPTSPEQHRSGDQTFKFRTDSDFYYLTRFPEPESIAVLMPEQEKFILFCRERDAEKETWNGRREGIDGAIDNYHADEAFPIDKFDDMLPGLLENQPKVFCNMGRYPHFDEKLIEAVTSLKSRKRAGVSAPAELVDIGPILHELRLIKRSEELRIMRRAAKITSRAHHRAMKVCKPGMFEYQIQAEVEHEFLHSGCMGPAYHSIVAGGENACILHYIENTNELKDGELLLIDAGGELDHYASDITRTFPINGKFSGEQKAVYDIVLAAQLAAIEESKAGKQWNEPHDISVKIITEGLVDIGLLKGNPDDLIENQDYKRFYMHRIGHWLGMDVHDVGDYKVDNIWRLLEPGMVMTIEPGIYINPAKDIDSKWHNIGIRIEDNVLITKNGPEIITDVVKTTDDIEHFMAQGD